MSLLLGRGINILRNRKEQVSQGVTSSESQGSQSESRLPDANEVLKEKMDSPEQDTPAPASKRPNLAARRGKTLLAINLGSGTYFVPVATSTATTPTEMPSRRGSAQAGMDGFLGASSTQHLLDYSMSSPSSASPTSSSQAPTSSSFIAPFGNLGPSSPTSEKLLELNQTTRRKSSVTFADALTPAAAASSPHRSPVVQTPTLELVPASPLLPQVSLQDALSTNWSESVRSLSKERVLEEKE